MLLIPIVHSTPIDLDPIRSASRYLLACFNGTSDLAVIACKSPSLFRYCSFFLSIPHTPNVFDFSFSSNFFFTQHAAAVGTQLQMCLNVAWPFIIGIDTGVFSFFVFLLS
jgi:hypothetical protein